MALTKLNKTCLNCGCSLFRETLQDLTMWHSYIPTTKGYICKGCYTELKKAHVPIRVTTYKQNEIHNTLTRK